MNNELIAGNYEDLFVFLDLIYNRRGEVVTKDDDRCCVCVETCDNSDLKARSQFENCHGSVHDSRVRDVE